MVEKSGKERGHQGRAPGPSRRVSSGSEQVRRQGKGSWDSHAVLQGEEASERAATATAPETAAIPRPRGCGWEWEGATSCRECEP
mmetsp:Transcript_17415/g.53823  ORF Transcript_17415/g.53823 Transcript_17415/m.53823 type:complete len:85 (+) Transcript_17415:941-1195(+)